MATLLPAIRNKLRPQSIINTDRENPPNLWTHMVIRMMIIEAMVVAFTRLSRSARLVYRHIP
jgi:hypothetical protein